TEATRRVSRRRTCSRTCAWRSRRPGRRRWPPRSARRRQTFIKCLSTAAAARSISPGSCGSWAADPTHDNKNLTKLPLTSLSSGGQTRLGMTNGYLETISLVERLHRHFLEVVKLELDGLGIHDINNVQGMMLFNIGDA